MRGAIVLVKSSYRVAILDDQPMWIEALTLLLRRSERIEVVGRASNQQEAVEVAQEQHPDLFLVDIDLKHRWQTGISATLAIREVSPQTDVIILTCREESKDVADAAAAGAIDFLPKSDGELLLPAILKWSQGGFNPRRILVNYYATLRKENITKSLTEQENEILQLLLEDVKSSQLPKSLNKSEHTIKTQIRSILHKMGVTRTADAVSKYKNAGLHFPGEHEQKENLS